MTRVDVAIVGAGVVGAAMAYDCATRGVEAVVLEAHDGPASGASGANSGIIHSGFDAAPGSFEAAMIAAQGERFESVFDELAIPYRRCGALMLAADDAQAERLLIIAEDARSNGVETQLCAENAVRELEPHARARAGLLISREAITDPYEATARLLAVCPDVRYRWQVTAVEPTPGGGAVVHAAQHESVLARYVINCAGLFADVMAGDASFSITPRRGEFVVFGQEAQPLVSRILLPVPNEQTKGVLVFPTLYEYLCAGPTAVDQVDKEHCQVDPQGLVAVRESAARMIPELAQVEPVDSWAGLRTVGHPRNYIAEWSQRVPDMFNVAGIRSTGLSACLGLSLHVLERCGKRGLQTRQVRRVTPRVRVFERKPWWKRTAR